MIVAEVSKPREVLVMNNRKIRARIRRVYVTEGLYFITTVTRDRLPILAGEKDIALLRQTLRAV
jgi:hypothetical protein